MTYTLPTSLEVNSTEYAINADYRRILDIIEILSDPEFTDEEKALTALGGFYADFEDMPYYDYGEAMKQMNWFIDGGMEPDAQKSPRVMDWEQDFPYIISPINRVVGKEIRAVEFFHWWSFLSAYQEIGDCLFAQIVGIRSKKARGKKLDKQEQEFYKRNRKMIDLKTKYTAQENEALDMWLGKR